MSRAAKNIARGRDVAWARRELGLTPRAFGEIVGASQSSVYRRESQGDETVKAEAFSARMLTLVTTHLRALSDDQRRAFGAEIATTYVRDGGLRALHHFLSHVFVESLPAKYARCLAVLSKTTPAQRQFLRRAVDTRVTVDAAAFYDPHVGRRWYHLYKRGLVAPGARVGRQVAVVVTPEGLRALAQASPDVPQDGR